MRVSWQILIIGGVAAAGGLTAAMPAYAGGSTVQATVTYDGPAPARKPINFGAEKQCALMHGDAAPLSEDLVVGANGAMEGVLVYVKEGIAGAYEPPTETAVVEQVGCVFKPHVMAIQAGQPIEFRNEDAVLHNVRALSKQGQAFNIAQPVKGMKTQRKLAKPEIGLQVKCDVHFWMVGYLHVLPHPFFGVSGADGTIAIKDLPDGTYTLEAWHEKLGAQTQTITVTGGAPVEAAFVFRPTS